MSDISPWLSIICCTALACSASVVKLVMGNCGFMGDHRNLELSVDLTGVQ